MTEGWLRALRFPRYFYRPARGYWFTSFLAQLIESGEGCFNVTLDIGLTQSQVCRQGGYVRVGDVELPITDLKPTEPDRVVFFDVDRHELYEVVKHTESGFYKLKAVGLDVAPTLEINGIHMHRIKDVDPITDTLYKIRALRPKRGGVVLDTCLGLGYTAIMAAKSGASLVVSFEIDPNVVYIAERNPWSRGLVDDRVKIYLGDVVEAVYELPDEFFDRVIHDPPRFTSSTGDLYSQEFYNQLFRVLKPGGVLFHYTGEPRARGPPSILKGIKERLVRAGFVRVFFDRRALGFTAVKPG